MSIVGLGTDIVEVRRVRRLLERHGPRFLSRCFGGREQTDLTRCADTHLAARVAGRWAAKEAFLKALGGRIAHIPYRDVRVGNGAGGAPLLEPVGAAARALARRGGRRVHVTISHERQFAVATVVIED